MTTQESKRKLKSLHITQIDLAAQLNKSTTAISLVINGKLKSPLIARKIAALVAVDPAKLHAMPTAWASMTEPEEWTARASRLVNSMKSALDGEEKSN